MSRIFEIADQYVNEIAALDPTLSTALGIPGHEREMPDYSPDGTAAVADLNRRTVGDLESAAPDGERDRIARDFMRERLSVRLALVEAKENLRELRIIASPMQGARSVFDQMPKESEEDWSNIAARLKLVPEALAGFRASLNEGIAQGLVAAKRQSRECQRQAEIWSGQREGEPGFFDLLLGTFEKFRSEPSPPALSHGVGEGESRERPVSTALAKDVEAGVQAAKDGYAEMARYLRDEYEPKANEEEAAGEDRYRLMNRVFLGASIDLKETYEWGWEEQWRIDREMEETAAKIADGGSVDDAMEILEHDPSRCVDGVDAYQSWLQELHDEALEALHGMHFDIDERIRRIEVMIPPPGGALAPYYSGPSEDFKRPGRTWWPTGTRTVFPKWSAVSTAYHEGVPGHHLQVGSSRCLGDKMSRFQSLLGFVSGYGEGWALYAERLMGELGFLENPDYYMGLLSAQALRACRVIVDIGMHLELKIPENEKFHPGEVWNHDLAREFVTVRSRQEPEFVKSEIVRYLGWPGQAISYKVGERKWLEVREAAKRKAGASFDLKQFHTDVLDLGPLGLEQLEREMGGVGVSGK
ncbi:MAG: DUF885 domain-containing protein [Chloroflexi bacterium]|nr:DUF885 domain-containing protein [Chloroflexota bacterium]